MDHFGAVTGATAEEMAAVTEKALEMGRTTVFSAIEAAGAMVELGKAGLGAKEIMEGIGQAVVDLAAAGDIPLTEATEVLVTVMRTFNLEAKDEVYIADQLAGAANASTIEVKDLAVSLKYTGGVASALGIPLHDVADALAILGNNGIRGSTAGTTLRRILLELNPATKKQVENLRELGIIQDVANVSTEQLAANQAKVVDANNKVATAQERVNELTQKFADSGAPKTAQEAAYQQQQLAQATEDLADAQELATRLQNAHKLGLQATTNEFFKQNGEAKSLGEIFQIVEERTKHLNKAEKQRVLDIMFGSRAIAGAIILSREGAKGFAEMSAQIEKVSAAEVARKRLDNLSGSLKRLKNVLITEMVLAAGPLLDSLKAIADRVIQLISAFGGLPSPVRQGILIFMALFGTAAILGGGLLILASFVARAIRGFKELRGMFVATNTAKKALDKNVPILAGRFKFLGFIVKALLSPFALLRWAFMGIIGAIAGFLGISVGLVAVVLGIIAIFAILIWKVTPVREFFKRLGASIWEFIQKVPGYLGGFVDTVAGFFARLGGLWNTAVGAVGGFFSRLPGIIGGALMGALGAVGRFIASVGGFFARLPGIVAGFLSQVMTTSSTFLEELPARVLYFVGYMIGLFLRLGWGIVQAVLAFSSLVGNTFISFFTMLWNTAVEWGPRIFNAIVEFFILLPGRIVGFLDMVWEAFWAWAVRMHGAALEMGANVLNGIVEWFQLLPGRVIGFIDRTWEAFHAWAVRMHGRALEMGANVINGVVEWFQQLPGRVAGFVSETWNRFTSWAGDMASRARQMASDVYNGIVNGIQGLPGTVGGILNRVIDAFLGVISRAWSAAKNLASSLWNGFKAGLGISSPSFIERAMWSLTDNVAGSIKDLRGQVKTIQRLGKAVANPMSPDFNSPAAWAALEKQIAVTASSAQQVGAQNVFNNEFHTNADPEQISSQIMWDQLVRVR